MEHFIDKTMTTYADEIQMCETQINFYIQSVKYQEILTQKLHKISNQNKNIIKLMKNTKTLLETEIKQDEQKKESLLIALDSMKARNVELRKEILLIKDRRQNIIERNINIKAYEDHWLMCQKRFENIPFIHRYIQINNKIETLKENNSTHINEIKSKYLTICVKNTELFNLDIKHVVQLADYMINKRLIILKNIKEKRAEIEFLENQIKIKGRANSHSSTTNELLASSTKKQVPMDIIQESSTVENNYPTVLPKLQLQYMDLDLFPVKFDQNQRVNFERAVAIKGTLDFPQQENDNTSKKIKINKVNEEYVSPYFASPDEYKNPTQKFSEKKLIHILQDVKLDVSGAYKIISKVNTNELQNVNIFKAEVSQKDLKEKESSQEKVKEQVENEVLEEVDLTKTSQNILVPPTQFLDFTQSSQEKRVTFNSIITIQNSSNLVTNEKKCSDEILVNNAINSQLNVSAASDDSYKKIQDFVFKKHNLNSSPEFIYGKNLVAPMLPEKGIPSNVLEEQDKAQIDDGKQSSNFSVSRNNQLQLMEIVENPNNAENTLEPEQTTQIKLSENQVEEKICIKKDDGAVAGLSYKNYLHSIPNTFNISMNTTDCEDTDTDFPQYVDSSLLLSPKADDEIPTSSNKADLLSQDVPNFLSGLKKTGFSFFGSKGSERNLESDIHGGNFNFTFGEEKKKRGGLFNMFR